MNGSNGDSESDARPMHLCPMDLAKLQEALGFADLLERERALEAMWQHYNVTAAAEFHRLHVLALTGAAGTGAAKLDSVPPAEQECEPCHASPHDTRS